MKLFVYSISSPVNCIQSSFAVIVKAIKDSGYSHLYAVCSVSYVNSFILYLYMKKEETSVRQVKQKQLTKVKGRSDT